MKQRNKLVVALVAGSFMATAATGSAFALSMGDEQKQWTSVDSSNTFNNVSQKIDQTNEEPDVKKIQAETDSVKTIKLNDDDVNILGASWEGENPQLKIRYKNNGTWSSWEELPKDDEGGPDVNSKEYKNAEKVTANNEHSSEAVPVVNSEEVQLKSSNKNSNTDNLEITKVSTEVTEEDKSLAGEENTVKNIQGLTSPQQAYSVQNASYTVDQSLGNDFEAQSSTYLSALKGNIVTRKEWGANEKLKRCSSSSTSTAKGVFVHHTAGSNSYTKSQAPGIIRGYLSFHTQSKGWCDLGYNFLVDKYGTIYEGRAGSITKAMTGAHASGFNSYTLGVSVLGTYTGSAPSSAAQNSVKRIIAWKANQYGFNPTGKMTLTSGGGGTSKYGAGKKVSLNVVSGHRDTSYTECPGLAFYKKLSSIRSGAKSLQSTLKGGSSGGSVTPPKPTPIAPIPKPTTPKYVTKGAIGKFYKKNSKMTGAPTGNEKKISKPAGYYQWFKNGKVYYSKKTGAHFIKSGTFNNAYKAVKYEKGSLGYPTSEIKKFKYRSGGTYQNFEKGMITYSKQTGAKVMTTTMLNKWKSLGWERSTAKLPTKAMKCGLKNGGCYQQFEGGKLHWSKKSGVHFTKDKAAIQKAWIKAKGTSGKLGYPTTEEFKSGSKIRQNFTGGYITYTKKSGAKIYYSKK